MFVKRQRTLFQWYECLIKAVSVEQFLELNLFYKDQNWEKWPMIKNEFWLFYKNTWYNITEWEG